MAGDGNDCGLLRGGIVVVNVLDGVEINGNRVLSVDMNGERVLNGGKVGMNVTRVFGCGVGGGGRVKELIASEVGDGAIEACVEGR